MEEEVPRGTLFNKCSTKQVLVFAVPFISQQLSENVKKYKVYDDYVHLYHGYESVRYSWDFKKAIIFLNCYKWILGRINLFHLLLT